MAPFLSENHRVHEMAPRLLTPITRRRLPCQYGGVPTLSTVWRVVVLVAALVVVAPAAGHAAPQVFVSLEYQVMPGASGCADATGFRNGVQRQLGYDPFRAQADRRVAVQIARNEADAQAGYSGRIQWTDAQGHDVGQRRLTTGRAGCADIVNNVAFAVAVQIQLLAALGPPRRAQAVQPSPPPRPTPPGRPTPPAAIPPASTDAAEIPRAEQPAPPPPTTPPPERAQPPLAPPVPVVVVDAAPAAKPRAPNALRLSMGLGPSLALAVTPHPTASGRLFVDARAGWFSFELTFDATLRVQQQEATGTGFSLRRYAAGGAACGHARVFGACVTGVLGRLEATGHGVDMPLQPAGFSGQVGARVFASHDLGARYFITLRVEGLVMLSRWTVTVNEIPVWTTPRLAALIGADVGVRFF